MARLDELPQLYRELRLLRLKYEHLADVCKSLMKNWPNRNSDGRLVKAMPRKTTATGQELVTEHVMPTLESPQQPESSELQLLEGILSKAQKIRICEEEQRKVSVKKKTSVAAESCKMAANVYQPTKQRFKPGSGNPASQHKRPLTKTSVKSTKAVRQPSVPKAVPHSKAGTSAKSERGRSSHSQGREGGGAVLVRVERHTGQGDTSEEGHVISHVSVSHPESLKPLAAGQPAGVRGSQETSRLEEGRSFNMLQDGSKLRMPSKYYTLHSSLAKIRDYITSQRGDPTCEAARAHFLQRLIPQEKEVPVRAIQLQLAREEYQLLTEELEAISPQEWAVSDKSQWQDVLRLKVRLDQLLARARTLKEELVEPGGGGAAGVGVAYGAGVGVACGAGVGVACGTCVAAPPEGPLVYSSLDQWLRLVELEHTLHMQRLEKAVLEFCIGAILPQLRERRERMSTQCLQMLSELAGQPKPIFISNQPPT